ncbi:hypothetical protein [Streptomyces paradoxus]|uniref:hypothetical protein n=1 Tax=Streptomyces paradoxus TaxID=66375 RepID=UPI00382BD084
MCESLPEEHQDGAEWLPAVPSSQGAAQLILSSGEPVGFEVTAWVRQHGTAVRESDYSNRTSTGCGNGSESSSQSGQSAV